MGQFSWIASDRNKSIRNDLDKGSQIVTMVYYDLNEVEHRVTEDYYEGYGVFGGVDFYEALSWMNPNIFGEAEDEVEHTRERGIRIYFGDMPYKSPQLFLGKAPEVVNFDNKMVDDPNQGWGVGEEEDDDYWEDDEDEDW